jgi:hypothetical protein
VTEDGIGGTGMSWRHAYFTVYASRMTWSQTVYQLDELFAREDQTPTALATSLELPARLLKAARAVFVCSLGGPSPIHHVKLVGVEGTLAWWLKMSERPFSLTTVTLPWLMEAVPIDSRLDCIDELMTQLAPLPELRAASMRELLRVAHLQGCSDVEMAELDAYARAAGM